MVITKTDFIAFLDAPRHLWAIKHNKISEREIDMFIQHLLDQGYEVEGLAKEYIQEILIPNYNADISSVIFQPAYMVGSYQARADVLIKNIETDKWDIYEVKSTNSAKKRHIYDAAFQYLVFKEKYDIGTINILHLNKDYVLKGDLDLSELFQVSDITGKVIHLSEEVRGLRRIALYSARMPAPNLLDKCIKPKSCPCIEVCHPNLPEYSIYDINYFSRSARKVRSLIDLGIESVYDMPETFQLSALQRFQVAVAKGGEVVIDKGKIREDLESLTYPLYFIDYEAYNPAVPMYDGYKPFDQMPFQWSLHIRRKDGSDLEHYEFIETDPMDPIPHFLEALQRRVGTVGSLIVWNKSFEGTQNKRMGEIYPQFNDFCLDMNSRMYDLMGIFKRQWYADPKLKGSFSIKKVLPALAPGVSYVGMDIAEGATAMMSWYEMVYGDSTNKEKIKADLLKYCALDTLAMVKILEKVYESLD